MSENLRYYLEKATKEFVYPTIQATPEEVEFVVVPMMEAVLEWLEQKRKANSNFVEEAYWIIDDLIKEVAPISELQVIVKEGSEKQ